MSWRKITNRDLSLALVLIGIGVALYFVIMASLEMPLRWIVLAVVIGGVLLSVGSSLWKIWHHRHLTAIRHTLIVEEHNHGEITFAPEARLKNPTLYLWASRPGITVIEVWFAGAGTLLTLRSLDYWRDGVTYEGVLDSKNSLRILMRNDDSFPTTVRAKIIATKDQG